jgi:hypothetical protein
MTLKFGGVMIVKYVCKRCGVPCGYWHFGWKHHGGWHTKKSCGQKPIPVKQQQEQQS